MSTNGHKQAYMAKKGSKNQPKWPNAANIDDTVTIPVTATTTSQPVSAPQVNAHAPARTQLTFLNFINIATTDNIKKFLEFAATTTEGENLLYLLE